MQGKTRLMGTSPDPLLSSFRSLNEQRPTVPKEGSTSLQRLLRKQNEFVYKLIALISSAIIHNAQCIMHN